MKAEQLSWFEKFALWFVLTPFPVGVLSGMGYLGYKLVKQENGSTSALFGGIILAVVVSIVLFQWLKSIGVDEDTAYVCSIAVGMSGEKGYDLLMARANAFIEGKKP